MVYGLIKNGLMDFEVSKFGFEFWMRMYNFALPVSFPFSKIEE